MRVLKNGHSLTQIASAAVVLISLAGLAGCGGNDDNSASNGNSTNNSNASTPAQTAAKTLTCDDSLKTSFQPDANTTVLMVKSFKKGDALLLSGTATSTTPVASNDVCMVKLNVGPGNPGPAGLPSTTPGIGIEIWLPAAANWNNRVHVKGGGGWAGGTQSSTTAIASAGTDINSAAGVAMSEGAVSATTDTGHSNTTNGGSFAMNPDGTINTTLWKDFSERAIHEMAVKSKALAKVYYGKDAQYSYWDGFSTGGRQGHKEAQANPADFDGILAGAPAFNWTKFITSELYPQIVYQRDLNGTGLTSNQITLLGNAAINACDTVGGQHLGYIPDPSQCTYDPTKDAAVLCPGATGSGGVAGASTSADCVNFAQATAANKIWYGQTADGSVPDPAVDNGWSVTPASNQKWYGLTRGANVSFLAGPTPFTISSDIVALELQNPTLATTSFINPTGNGANGYKALSYAELANASDRGVALQSAFANINTDNADLSAFKARNGKMIMYHGLADILIMPQGSVNYYNRVATQMGGVSSIQSFYRFYLVPGMSHGFSNGTTNVNANPPLPILNQFYAALTDWVEKGTAPGAITANAAATQTAAAKSRPLCVYPSKAIYTSGDPNQAASYTCS